MSSKSSSSTQANQTQTTNTSDNRIVAEAGSVNLSGSNGNNVTVTAIDAGAVGKSFDFATQVSQDAASIAAASVGAVQAASTNAVEAVKAAYGDAEDQLAQAWADSKAGEQKMLAFGLLAVVAVVATKAVR